MDTTLSPSLAGRNPEVAGRAGTRVPGPRLPMAAQTLLSAPWMGDRFFRRCTERYGKTFRLNVYWLGDLVVTSDLELIRELFIARKDGDPLSHWMPEGSFPRMVGANPLTVTHGDEHRRHRRRLAEPFRELVRTDPTRLKADVRSAFDRIPIGSRHSLWSVLEPVLFESLLRDALGMTDPRRRHRLAAAFRTYYRLGHHPALFDPTLYELTERSGLRRRFEEAEREIAAVVEEELAAGPAERFRSDLLEAARNWAREIGVDERTMCVEFVKGAVYGGHRTTTAAATWTVLLLLHHSAVLQRLRAELADGSRTLLEGCVRESLRLFPPHPLAPSRRMAGSLDWGSMTLPVGSVLSVMNSLVHRDPSIYKHPHRFWPDRWDGWTPPSHGWLPFGAGLRRCLGQHWALQRSCDLVQAVVEHTRLAPARPRLEPVRLVKHTHTHGPRWGAEVIKLGTLT